MNARGYAITLKGAALYALAAYDLLTEQAANCDETDASHELRYAICFARAASYCDMLNRMTGSNPAVSRARVLAAIEAMP